jgi:UDP-3-O-[3-hydroxymyristoyl] N-acetylglucosamine deacetylase
MMTTILNKIEVKSAGLMTGVECTAKLEPSNIKGIRFHFGGNFVEADVNNVLSTDHCTVIGNRNVQIMLVEHFMAACAMCNIDSIDVRLSHNEMPILDGSSKMWVEALKGSGKKTSESYILSEPVYYVNGKTHLAVLPSDRLQITYGVNFNHPDLRQKWVSLNLENPDEIIEARTFGYLKELDALQAAGFAGGVSLENTIGLTDDGYTTTLRSELEPAKHKILDLIGDFYLTGFNPMNLKAEIIAKEAGHAVHTKVAKILKDKIIKET